MQRYISLEPFFQFLKFIGMRKKTMEMDIINPNCAGIDVGSKSHFVAVGQSLEDVREFGVYADDLTAFASG